MLTKKWLDDHMDGVAYLSDDDIVLLTCYAMGCENMVEIGVGYGASAIVLLTSTAYSKCNLTSIDPFVQDSKGQWCAGPGQAMRNVTELSTDIGYRWKLRPETSLTAAETWNGELLDLVFIDGDHTYGAVKADVEAWLPYIRQGGVLLLHDSRRPDDAEPGKFCNGWEGPTQVAKELRSDLRVELVNAQGAMTVWRFVPYLTVNGVRYTVNG